MNEEIFKNEAKTIVDLFFNNKLFKDEITRDDMNKTEEYIEFCLTSRFEMHIKCDKLMKSIESNVEKL